MKLCVPTRGSLVKSIKARVALLIRLGYVQANAPLTWSQVIFLMGFSGSFSLASGGLLWYEEC